MFTVQRVVDNRVFLLGLDKLYRDAMQHHERGELLSCSRRVAETLHTTPADVPVEGYYVDDARLTEYFRLIRALQDVDEGATSSVASLPEFKRLRDVVSAPLFGRPQYSGKLLPRGRDALSQALLDTFPDWTVVRLTAAAHSTALETDDISLPGLAARIEDPVVLAALRGSVVLYAEIIIGAALEKPRLEYIWKVDEDLAQPARRFIDTFNRILGEKLPPPAPTQAALYWDAWGANNILGRCIRLGCDDRVLPKRHYHWAIRRPGHKEFEVQDFWQTEIWTTTRYRSTIPASERGLEFLTRNPES
jgi:hypothetical protein